MDIKMGRRNQIITVITSMSNTVAVIIIFMFQGCNLTTQCVLRQGCRAGRHLPHHQDAARTRTQSKKAAKKAQVSGIFSERDMQVFNLLHKPTQLSRYMPRLMIISSGYFLMSSGLCVKPRRKTAAHFNPPRLLTHASDIFVILFHMLQDCGGFMPAGCQVNTKATYHCPPQLDKEGKSIKKGTQDKIRTGKDHSAVTIMGKTH